MLSIEHARPKLALALGFLCICAVVIFDNNSDEQLMKEVWETFEVSGRRWSHPTVEFEEKKAEMPKLPKSTSDTLKVEKVKGGGGKKQHPVKMKFRAPVGGGFPLFRLPKGERKAMKHYQAGVKKVEKTYVKAEKKDKPLQAAKKKYVKEVKAAQAKVAKAAKEFKATVEKDKTLKKATAGLKKGLEAVQAKAKKELKKARKATAKKQKKLLKAMAKRKAAPARGDCVEEEILCKKIGGKQVCTKKVVNCNKAMGGIAKIMGADGGSSAGAGISQRALRKEFGQKKSTSKSATPPRDLPTSSKKAAEGGKAASAMNSAISKVLKAALKDRTQGGGHRAAITVTPKVAAQLKKQAKKAYKKLLKQPKNKILNKAD